MIDPHQPGNMRAFDFREFRFWQVVARHGTQQRCGGQNGTQGTVEPGDEGVDVHEPVPAAALIDRETDSGNAGSGQRGWRSAGWMNRWRASSTRAC